MPKPLPFLLITLFPLTACTAWYKPGADDEELAIEQRRCEHETQASSGEPFIACMERAGWHHTAFSASATEPDIGSSGGPEEGIEAEQTRRDTQLGTGTGREEDGETQCSGSSADKQSSSKCTQGTNLHPYRLRISIEEPDSED